MVFLGILISFVIFSFIVLIHEYGHFKSARFFGVRVEEFGLGIPPRAKKLFTDKKGTLFSLNWLPLGGFVRISGENPHVFLVYNKKQELLSNLDLEKALEKGEDLYDKKGKRIHKKELEEIEYKLKENHKKYNLFQKPAWQQSIIILAGVFMNFVLAFIIFTALFLFGIKPIGINDKIEISSSLKLIPTYSEAVESGILKVKKGVFLSPISASIADTAGIRDGDLLLRVNGENFETIEDVQKIISENKEQPVQLYIERTYNCPDSAKTTNQCPIIEYLDIEVVPSIDGKIGTYLGPNLSVNESFYYKYNLIDSVKYGFLETTGQIHLTFKALGLLAQKIFFPETPVEREEAVESLAGPIGIVDFITSSLSAGVMFLIILTAIISINLGVFNLLPIPALDGGRFVFIIYNAIVFQVLGKKGMSYRVENSIHVFFFVVLIALSVIIAYNDIIRIFSK